MADSIRFQESGLQEMIQAFEKLEKPPLKLIAALEAELQKAFLGTKADTHVISTSLKNSGRTSSDYDGHTWTGEITYGGPSIPHEVDYAVYEQARGGDHDFMVAAYESEPEFQAIMEDWQKYYDI